MSFFSGPPDPQPAPTPPAQDPVDQAARDAQALAEARRLAAGGRASTILTGDLGESDQPKTATKQLLGQ